MPIYSFSAHDLKDPKDAKFVTDAGLAVPSHSGQSIAGHSQGQLILPLHLPNGSVVYRIRVFYRDNHAGHQAEIALGWRTIAHRSLRKEYQQFFKSRGSDPDLREADERLDLDPINNERNFYELLFSQSRHHDTLGVYSGIIYYRLS